MPSPIREVLAGKRKWAVDTADCIPYMEQRLPEMSVDIVFFSPPYEDARSYGEVDFRSGTTGHAALNHGRRYIGIDVWGGIGGTQTAIERLKQVEQGE